MPPPPQALAPPAPPVAPSAPPNRQDMEDLIRLLAKEHQVDPDFALSIAEVESNFNPKARSKAGARGLMQLMPATAKTYGVQNPDELDDPAVNIRAAMQYLRQLDIEHQGKPTMMARRYVGSPSLPPEQSDFYVRRVFDIYRRRVGLPPDTNNTDTDGRSPALPQADGPVSPIRGTTPEQGTIAPPPPFWSWAAHPIANQLVESLDPHERQGRQNLAGAAGSIVGGTIGGALAAPAGVPGGIPGVTTAALWGRRVGSGIGAGVAGGAEQALIEESGLGEKISQLPGGTQNEPTPPPPPDSTFGSRVAGAAANQGLTDVAGQAIMAPVRFVGKQLVQNSIARSAFSHLENARIAAADAFKQSQTYLSQQVRAAQEAAANAVSSLSDDIARRREALRVDLLGNTVRPARAAKTAVVDTARAGEASVAADYDAAVAQARQRAQAAVGGAEALRDQKLAEVAAGHEGRMAAIAPGPAAAGRSVAEVFEGAAQAPRRALGAAVDEAAETGPDRAMAALKAEAQRIDTEEQLPRIFPNHRVGEIVSEILGAPDDVPFAQLHAWKRELQESLRGVYDQSMRTQMQGATMKLAKMLRGELSGHAPYDAATKAYEDVIPRYTTQLAKTIRRSARGSPEDIAQMISADKPTQAGFLTKLMTEAASEGGDAAGGRKALENVQDVWFYKNVLDGPLETLGERLAQLKRSPEFVKNFLSDTRMKELLARTEKLAQEYPELVAQHDLEIASARQAGEAGVAATERAKTEAVGAAKDSSTKAIRAATERVTQAQDKAAAARATAAAGHRGERAALARSNRASVEAARLAKESAVNPTDAVDQALQRLRDSSLGGKLRNPIQIAADLFNVIKQPLGGGFAGLSLARLALSRGASDADVARYVIFSNLPVRALTRATVTSTLARPAPALASQPIKAAVGAKGEPTAGEIYLTIRGDKKKSTPPPKP